MAATELYQLDTHMRSLGIHFYYSGLITQDMLVSIGNALRKNAFFSNFPQIANREVAFAVFVEQIQNIIQYSATPVQPNENGELSFGVVAMGIDQGKFFIDCGNKIAPKDAESIRVSLNYIKALDRKELKHHYRNLLKKPLPTGSKGGGVGFVEIALRAKAGFEFNIVDIDHNVVFFNLRVFIDQVMHRVL